MVRYGILGAGKIARRFADSLRLEGDELYAISGRNEEKLNAFAREHPCQKIYLSHEELIEDPNIEAVYLSLPNFMHEEWACRAMRQKKAVLCEKPAAINESEMRKIQAVSQQRLVLFMEAMKCRFTPAFTKAVQLLSSGTIGELKNILVQNGSVLDPVQCRDRYYMKPELGGGCLLDVGCYGVSWLQTYLGNDLQVIESQVHQGTVDLYVDARMEGNGIGGRLICAFDTKLESKAVFTGTGGTMEVWPMHRPDHIAIRNNEKTVELSIPYDGDDFSGEIRHFDNLLRSYTRQSDVMSLADSCACAAILDRIRASFPSSH